MTSLRNSVHRRNHKERSQLAHRSRLGILEKHKDYVKRARDYHSKQDRLTRLRQKAADRNKDEFYFAMVKERTQGGVHIKDRGNVALPVDMVKVLKTQDENYIRTMRAAGLKKIDKLKNQLTRLANLVKSDDNQQLDDDEFQVLRDAGIISGPRKGKGPRAPKHIVFVDNEEEARQYATKMSTNDETASKKKKSRERNESSEAEEGDEQAVQRRRRLLKELSARLTRDKQLRYAVREFEMQRLLMGRGGRLKLKGVEKVEDDEDRRSDDEDEVDTRKRRNTDVTYKPRVYKWRLERKR